MPLPEDLSAAYKDYYTHGEKLSRSAVFRSAKYLYRLLVDAFLMIGGIPMERKRAALMFIGDRTPGALLDVGCGQGNFLALMVKRGWSVMGVDFDADAVEAARKTHNLNVRVGTVDTMLDTGITFDVVTASHVIEHVPDAGACCDRAAVWFCERPTSIAWGTGGIADSGVAWSRPDICISSPWLRSSVLQGLRASRAWTASLHRLRPKAC
jgi:SAM-dependent methyltransferase